MTDHATLAHGEDIVGGRAPEIVETGGGARAPRDPRPGDRAVRCVDHRLPVPDVDVRRGDGGMPVDGFPAVGIVRHEDVAAAALPQTQQSGMGAEALHALELQPDQPQVLNYLGYSLVERREKLDEALAMIERAVAQRPDNGAIVDSLGWVQFRLGDYAEAVQNLERAAELRYSIVPALEKKLADAEGSETGRMLNEEVTDQQVAADLATDADRSPGCKLIEITSCPCRAAAVERWPAPYETSYGGPRDDG